MHDPRENPVFDDLRLERKYRFYEERTNELIEELNNLAAPLLELTLSSCQNDQDFSENIRSQSIDIEQIETNKTVLVRMQQYIPIIKDKMSTLTILDDQSLSILNQFNDHITRLDTILTEYNDDLVNYHVKFLKYAAIGNAIKEFRSITTLLLHNLRIIIKDNLQKIFPKIIKILPASFLDTLAVSFVREESEEESILVPSSTQNSEESTNICSIESNGANQQSYDERIFLDLPQEIQILILSTMTCKDAMSLGMTASYYNIIMKDPLLWKVFFMRDFSYRYPTLTVFEKYRTIDWQEEYKLAKKNPPWPFPLEIKGETVTDTSADTLLDAIRNRQAESVISNLNRGIKVQRHYFRYALRGEFSQFIFELLVEAAKSNQEFLNYAFHVACEHNNSMAVAILIKADAKVNCTIFTKLEGSLSPLHVAIGHGDLFLVKMLLDLDAEVCDSDKFPLIYFLLGNPSNFDELKELSIFKKQDVNKRYEYKGRSVSLLEKTIIDQNFKNIKMFEWLLDSGANPNTLVHANNQTISIFHFLILTFNVHKVELIKILLKHKPNLEAIDAEGHTIIHRVIIDYKGFVSTKELILLLLDQNVKLDVTNNNGETILHSFLRRNQNWHITYLFGQQIEFILRILLNHIDVNSKDNQGVSPLDLAMNNVSALTSMILMKLVPTEICDKNKKENILHKFASMRLHDLNSSDEVIIRKKIMLLVRSGVDPYKKNEEGDTPLQIAVNENNILFFKALVESGVKITKLKLIKHRAYHEIHDAINCYRDIENAIATIKNMNSSLFFSRKPLDRIKNFIVKSSFPDNSLCMHLLSNYLFGDDLSSLQKERLVDSIFILDIHTLPISFWENLSKLAREGRSIQLPDDKIIKVLEVYSKLMKDHDRRNHPSLYQKEINQINELIANYRKGSDYVTPTSIQTLPEEMLVHIFSFLNHYPDNYRAGLVSRRFNDIAKYNIKKLSLGPETIEITPESFLIALNKRETVGITARLFIESPMLDRLLKKVKDTPESCSDEEIILYFNITLGFNNDFFEKFSEVIRRAKANPEKYNKKIISSLELTHFRHQNHCEKLNITEFYDLIENCSNNLAYVNLRSFDCRRFRIVNADLAYGDLRKIDFTDSTLCQANLNNANLEYATLKRTQFRSVKLRGANLNCATLNDVDFGSSDLTGASLQGVDLTHVRLNGVILNDASFFKNDLSDIDSKLFEFHWNMNYSFYENKFSKRNYVNNNNLIPIKPFVFDSVEKDTLLKNIVKDIVRKAISMDPKLAQEHLEVAISHTLFPKVDSFMDRILYTDYKKDLVKLRDELAKKIELTDSKKQSVL